MSVGNIQNLEAQAAFVAGAGQVVRLDIAQLLATHGASVVINDYVEVRARSMADQIGLRELCVAASARISEVAFPTGIGFDAELTRRVSEVALAQANQHDVVELHDAFTVQESHYVEVIGFCGPGQGVGLLKNGALNFDGQFAITPSGVQVAMGHPLGPTGIGHIGEITMTLSSKTGARQRPGCSTGASAHGRSRSGRLCPRATTQLH